MGQKDITEKVLEDYNDVFADIINGLLFDGVQEMYWMYMLYIIVVSPNSTGFLWYISSTIAFVIWMCLIEKEYRDIIMKRKN